MPKKRFIDEEEKELIEAYEAGEFVENKDSKQLKKMLEKAASNYLKKNARINIRISEADLHGLKIRASE